MIICPLPAERVEGVHVQAELGAGELVEIVLQDFCHEDQVLFEVEVVVEAKDVELRR